jgi:hypothetical protein
MKRKLLLLIFTALVACAPLARADVFLLGFTGFDYEDPNGSPGTYLALGEGYKAVGFVTSFGPLLTPYVDPSENEYTFYLFDLSVTARFFDIPSQFLTVQFTDNGRGRYFEDGRAGCSACIPGTAATYGVNPPNATAPSTFIDGTLALGGDVDQFQLYYDYSANQGGFSGNMTQDEGSNLIYIPSGQRDGWILGGLLGRPNPTVPDGYDNQISGECRIPATPTTHRTWGTIKALYR